MALKIMQTQHMYAAFIKLFMAWNKYQDPGSSNLSPTLPPTIFLHVILTRPSVCIKWDLDVIYILFMWMEEEPFEINWRSAFIDIRRGYVRL